MAAREQGEIQNLRREAKRLRSDNIALDVQVDDLQKRVRIWSSITALIAGSASALLLASLLFGNNESTEPVAGSDGVAESANVTVDSVTINDAVAPVAAPVEPVAAPVELNAAPVAAAPEGTGFEFPMTHKVKSGDTLGQIAVRYYGKASFYTHIQQANDLTGVNLTLGQKLDIPEPPEED